MSDEEEEEYDFDYSDDDQNQEESDIDLQNTYYTAKGMKEEDPQQALAEFLKVIQMEAETERGLWGFKALKQSMKLLFKLQDLARFTECYKTLLGYTRGAVTPNVSEKAVNGVLDYVSAKDYSGCDDSLRALPREVYELTLETLREHKNERLWFKTNLKLGHLLFEQGDLGRLHKVIKELLRSCDTLGPDLDPSGVGGDGGGLEAAESIKRGTQLYEVHALQILMYSRQRDGKKLREIYNKALRVNAAVPHPRTLATILECGGKMHMEAREWEQACTAFFQSFKSYDEAGEAKRLQVLKYLVMASILHKSTIDPFDSQEARPYKAHPEIVAMTNLVMAFRNDEIEAFERILKTHHNSIMGDPFIRRYIDDLLRTVRTQVLLKLVRPYTSISISYMAGQLNRIPEAEVEDLLVSLILDGKLWGKIDQVRGILVRSQAEARQASHPAAGGTGPGAAAAAAAAGAASEAKSVSASAGGAASSAGAAAAAAAAASSRLGGGLGPSRERTGRAVEGWASALGGIHGTVAARIPPQR